MPGRSWILMLVSCLNLFRSRRQLQSRSAKRDCNAKMEGATHPPSAKQGDRDHFLLLGLYRMIPEYSRLGCTGWIISDIRYPMSLAASLDTVPMTCCIPLQMEKLFCKQAHWEQCKPAPTVMNPMQKTVYSQKTLQKPSARPKKGGFIQLQKSWNHVWGHTSQWARLPKTTFYEPIRLSTTTSMLQ